MGDIAYQIHANGYAADTNDMLYRSAEVQEENEGTVYYPLMC